MIKKSLVVLFAAALTLLAGPAGWAQEPMDDQTQASVETQAKTLYEAAKKSIYEKNYADAIAKLKALTSKDAESPFGQEGLYWLGYSLDKLASTMENVSQSLEMKQDAIARLDVLLKNFPKNSWAHDARILQVQIAEALVKSGLGNYRRYINSGVSGGVQGGISGGVRGGIEGGVSGGVQGGISDQELDLKLVALDALLAMDAETAFPILEKMIRKDNRPELREKALFILSQGDKAKVVPILADIARKDPDPEMRKKALFWLGQTGAAESAAILKEIVLSSSETNELREQAVFGISQLQRSQSVPMLLEIIKSNAGESVREKAVFWLGQSGSSEAAKVLKDIVLTSSEPEHLREQAVFSISQLPRSQSVPMLIELTKSGTSVPVREKALFWLGQTGSPEAAKILRDIALSSTEADDLKEKAVFGVSQLPREQSVPMLIELTKTGSGAAVREKALFWLGQTGSPDAAKILRDIALSSTESDDLKEKAVFGISQLPREQSVPLLIELAKAGAGAAVREKTLFWLGQTGSPEAAKILRDVALSATESDDLKEKAVFGISQLPKSQGVPMLIEIAKSNASRSVREKAVFWLGQSKSPEAIKFLRDLIEK